MKITHSKGDEPKEIEWKFPCLGKSKMGKVVLFRCRKEGTFLTGNSTAHAVGSYRDDWDMDSFTPLPSSESITLQND